MDPQPDSLTIAQLQRRLDATQEANDALAAEVRRLMAVPQQQQRLETEVATVRAKLLEERNAMPSHDPRLTLATELVDALGALIDIAPAPLPIAADTVPEVVQPLHAETP